MARYLISFVGAGRNRDYSTAKYSFEGKEIGESKFVASLLVKTLKIDSLILIGTVKSIWEEVYNHFSDEKDEKIIELAGKCEGSNNQTDTEEIQKELDLVIKSLPPQSNCVVIPYGITTQEQLTIFQKIAEALECLKDGDEIILDITHAFRSLPLFANAVIKYLKEVKSKKIKFDKIYYGMLDAKNEFSGIAPIVDISSSILLTDWTTAAHEFKAYGKGYLLAELTKDSTLKDFSDAVSLNRLNEIQNKLTNFQESAKRNQDNEYAKFIIPEALNSFASRLEKHRNTQHLFQLELATWHFEKKNYSSAYIVFTEAIVTYECEKKGDDWKKIDQREDAKKRLKTSPLNELYEDVKKIRNSIAHNYASKGKKTNPIENFSEFSKEFKKIVNNKI